MEPIKLNTHVGDDGILKLEVPLDVRDIDFEVTIALQPQLSQEDWLTIPLSAFHKDRWIGVIRCYEVSARH